MAKDNRTADEIERDLERERARLGNTLDQLSDRLSVENITGEVTNQLKGLGTDAFRGTTDRLAANARANPAAVAIAGAGLLWLLMSSEKAAPNPAMPSLRPTDDDRPPPLPSQPPVPAEAKAPMPERVKDAGAETLETIRDEAANLRARLAEGTENLTAEGKKRVIAAREAAIETLDTTIQGVKSKARGAAASVEENPWVYGGIALALGAAIGGALLYRKSEQEARSERNELFAEADRIFREETERSTIDRNTAVSGVAPRKGAVQ